MDTQMLRALQARDADAQLELRRRMLPKIVAVCRHMLDDPVTAEQTAEDIVTDFLFAHVDRVRSPVAVAAYLRMTTVRRCTRLRDLRARTAALDETAANATPLDDAVLGSLDDRRQMARLLACLDELAPRPRQILRLRFRHDHTLEHIGAALGVSKQYVSKVAGKSLAALRRCMERRR